MTRPPTWSDIERAILNGRVLPWADAIPGFWEMTAGERTLRVMCFLPRFLPTEAEDAALQALGLFPDAINSMVVHLIEHLNTRKPLHQACVICRPLPPGVKVGEDGSDARRIRAWGPEGGEALLNTTAVRWHCAGASKPAALEALKQRILKGDREAVDRVAAKERVSSG